MTAIAGDNPAVATRAEIPPFPGACELLRLLARLYRREWRRGPERALPMICLVRDHSEAGLLPGLAARLKGAAPLPVPHALLDMETVREAPDVAPLLHALCEQLSPSTRFGKLRFRHYLLAEWLMRQDLRGVDLSEREKTLARRLRDRSALGRGSEVLPQASEAPNLTHRALILLLRMIPLLLFRAQVSGRLPGPGAVFRWFMRQQYLAPRQSGSFLGFAERLTAGSRDGEDTEQLNKLLVHAFLQDLRCAYRRRPWRLEGWRRTTCPTVLLDNISRTNLGYLTLRLVNDVRNETGRSDPLLVVAASQKVPPDAGEPGRNPRVVLAHNTEVGYEAWLARLRKARRRRENTAWYLPVSVPADTGGDTDGSAAAHVRDGLDSMDPLVTQAPPWWARPIVPLLLCLALLGALTLAVRDWGQGHCGLRRPGAPVALELLGTECVGFSASGDYFFTPVDHRLAQAEARVYEQNRRAESAHARDPGRTFVTLVYLGMLTSPDPSDQYVSESADLEGIAVAQYENNEVLPARQRPPLVRVVVANVGQHMVHSAVVARMITRLARRDPSVVGVVGLDESRTQVFSAIKELNRVGLPVVVPSLSADNLVEASPLYYQIAPANQRHADVVAAYAAHRLKVTRARIYYSVRPDDTYASTLRADLLRAFKTAGITVEFTGDWTKEPNQLARACGFPGLIFYAGRTDDFVQFLPHVQACQRKPRLPILGDDALTRFIANRSLRESTLSSLPLAYLSAASQGACPSDARPALTPPEEQHQFYRLYREFWRACEPGSEHPMMDWAVLSYDAVQTMVRAVRDLTPQQVSDQRRARLVWQEPLPPTPGAVWRQLGQIRGVGAIDGASGRISFGPPSGPAEPSGPAGVQPGGSGRVAWNKAITILRYDHINEWRPPKVVFSCGDAGDKGPAPDPTCPDPR